MGWAARIATVSAMSALILVAGQGVRGQATVQGSAMRGQGQFLRGMAWYELGSAQGAAIEVESMKAWNQAVQADYNQYFLDRSRRAANKKALRNEVEQEALKTLAANQQRWRTKPTVDDIRSGLALNALASDLADPKIPPTSWRTAAVDLPEGATIQALAFRVAGAPKVRLPSHMMPSSVAIGRIKVTDQWPLALRRTDLESSRAAYQRAVAAVIARCRAGQPLKAAEVDAVRESLLTLKDRAAAVVPRNGGQLAQANAYLDRLDEATRIFLDRDFAEELIRDVENHKAKTVGELLGFMKKYRLLFAESDENSQSWAVYQTLYDALKRQKVVLDFADFAEKPAAEDPPEPK